MKRSFSALIATILMCLAPLLAKAQSVQRIAAIVNDQVISDYDLNERTKLIILSAGLPDTEETRKRIMPQVLRALVNETIQLQEAESLNLRVDEAEVDQAISILEKRNNIPEGRFEAFFRDRGVDKNTVIKQIRSELAWGKVVRRKIFPKVIVTDEEVQSTLDRLKANAGKKEYLVSEIFLPIDRAEQERDVYGNAARLTQEMRKGAPFHAVARQFSQSATAGQGGDIGWVQPDDLRPEIAAALSDIRERIITDPIRTPVGYYIIGVRQIRKILESDPAQSEVDLKQILLPLKKDADAGKVASVKRRADELAGRIRSCADVEPLAKEADAPGSGELGRLRISDMPEKFRAAVINLQENQASQPVRTENGYHILVVCSRTDKKVEMPSPGSIKDSIANRRIASHAERYLRDLRRDAVIEFR